ncbi:hypothetical protein QU926_12700 [Pseudomonas asiatica]|uniref:hypothetical protein n=1 Tax=Pseudomonas asiatica TaxID=2219225 RepID=UPI0025AB3773|nr:hypothetical protein [Pseudomonas asiatica]MDM9554511.1 hypothetical protein [Pseudomonas asiatica]
MQLHEVDQVREVYSVQDANQWLAKGWKLITVVAVTNPNTPQYTTTCYVLGLKT